ncbi:limonene-1,2-epoxide hydrolase family protein [Mycobacterium sp. ITM-2016-00318]|uniref:limonene-1,2-epoxide hydrolase family protein n=1 Tax=Mycobacterium sp. ITM-2016-00318 TaxID=2099693 RepID=UPI000CFA145B|nr:limonene-1,2-epoxide hydrolase family protein [Mycobacterium sp. ITM-2016-00318]WNG94893.1 limonene-1,2-epoxide hydrolase family protein [Mycobacterium sp. ITM-2016-00318]
MTASTPAVDTTANARVVETFLYALQDQDFDTADASLADNIVWENVGYPTMRGRKRIVGIFRRGQGRVGFEVKFHRIAAEGNAVLTERTDALIFGPVRMQFWVCGVFEVHGGKITLWRDYFDLLDVVKGTVRGLVGTFVPALRPTM